MVLRADTYLDTHLSFKRIIHFTKMRQLATEHKLNRDEALLASTCIITDNINFGLNTLGKCSHWKTPSGPTGTLFHKNALDNELLALCMTIWEIPLCVRNQSLTKYRTLSGYFSWSRLSISHRLCFFFFTQCFWMFLSPGLIFQFVMFHSHRHRDDMLTCSPLPNTEVTCNT